jgi:hypothetical protein
MVLEAIESGSPADIHASIIGVNKTLDPASVVRGEEVDSFKSMHSAWANAMQLADKWVTGDPMGSQQKRELKELTQRLLGNANQFHEVMEAEFSNELSDAKIGIEYSDNFRNSKNYPRASPYIIKPDLRELATQKGLGAIDEAADAGVELLDTANNAFRDGTDVFFDSVLGAGESVVEFLNDPDVEAFQNFPAPNRPVN